jgi:hypothetical protein
VLGSSASTATARLWLVVDVAVIGPAHGNSLQPNRIDSGLCCLVAIGRTDEIRRRMVALADSLDKVGAAVQQANSVVGGISGRQRSVRDQTLI